MDKLAAHRLMLEGKNYGAIAKELHVSRQSVWMLLRAPNGIRNAVVSRYRGICQTCGLGVGVGGHIHEVRASGLDSYDDLGQLTLLCNQCARAAHAHARET